MRNTNKKVRPAKLDPFTQRFQSKLDSACIRGEDEAIIMRLREAVFIAKAFPRRHVRCYGSGHKCEALIPDTDHSTLQQHGWGFMLAPDPGMGHDEKGRAYLGNFFACPEHCDELTPEQRKSARELYALTAAGKLFSVLEDL
jgi:hypothetical protein